MRPKHIQVFDGLRITTEHMEHLQGGFYSAVEDFRAILGLGSIQYGFEVEREGERAVIVHPGLAFDRSKNRIACDEAKRLDVSFEEGETTQYVCISYHQIQEGEVEGRFTLIYDSCAAEFCAALPEPDEDRIPIAALTKSTGEAGESFTVTSMIGPLASMDLDTADPPPEASEPVPEVGPQDSVETGIPGESEDSNLGAGTHEPTRVGAPQNLLVHQGVTRLDSGEAKRHNISGLFMQATLQDRDRDASASAPRVDLLLQDREIGLPFPPMTISCQSIVTMTFRTGEEQSAHDEEASTGAVPWHLQFRSTAQGEWTFQDNGVSQFGVSTLQAISSPVPPAASDWTSELTEDGVAHLPLALLEPSAEGSLTEVWSVLRDLELIVRLAREPRSAVRLECYLIWRDSDAESAYQTTKAHRVGYAWDVQMAWKALGASTRMTRTS